MTSNTLQNLLSQILFFLTAEYYSKVYMYHIFIILSSAEGRLGCFYFLLIMNIEVTDIADPVSEE